jgi:hypothetical protein
LGSGTCLAKKIWKEQAGYLHFHGFSAFANLWSRILDFKFITAGNHWMPTIKNTKRLLKNNLSGATSAFGDCGSSFTEAAGWHPEGRLTPDKFECIGQRRSASKNALKRMAKPAANG